MANTESGLAAIKTPIAMSRSGSGSGPALAEGNGGRPAVIIAVAFLAWLLTNIDQSLFGYAIPDIRQEFGVDLNTISIVISASFVAGMILPILVGSLTDRWGPRWTLTLCLGVSAFFVGVQGLLYSFPEFAGARIISFGLSACLSPITNAMVATAAPAKWRPMLIALLQCAYPLGWFSSSLLVAPLIEQVGWRTLFFAGFFIAALSLLMGFFIPRRVPAPVSVSASGQYAKAASGGRIAALFSPQYRKRTLLCGLAVFLNSGAVAATAFYLPTFLHEVRGYSVSASALVVGSSYGVSVIGYLGSAYVSMRWMARRDTIVVWNVLAAILFMGMVWLPTSLLQDVAAFSVTAIFFYGVTAILITYLLEVFPESLRTTAAAVSGTACVSGSMVVFPFITAQMVGDLGWQVSFSCIVSPALLLSALAMLNLPRVVDEDQELLPAATNLSATSLSKSIQDI